MLDFFTKSPLPQHIPSTMQKHADDLRRTKSKHECLKQAYDIITKRYYGDSLPTLTRGYRLFYRDTEKLWNRKGFLHCTHQNYLLRVLLMRSGKFFDKDIQLAWTWLNVAPHQYLRVRTEKGVIDVDPWAHKYKVPFGKHAGI